MEENNFTYLINLAGNVCKDVFLKCAGTGILVISEFLVDDVLAKAMLGLLILILFDWVTGTMAARHTGDHIKSAKIFRTPVKIVVYFMLVTGARISEYSLPDMVHFIDETVVAFLTLTEMISLLENTGKMGYPIPIKILKKLRKLRDE
jgi:phage-related holin